MGYDRTENARQQRTLFDIGNGYRVVAEVSDDPQYPREIFVGIEDKNGAWVQDLVIVQNAYDYHLEDDGDTFVVDYKDGLFDVFVFGNGNEEDCTEQYSIELRKDLGD